MRNRYPFMRNRYPYTYHSSHLLKYLLSKSDIINIRINNNDKYNYIALIFHWFDEGNYSFLNIRYKYTPINNTKWRRK